MSADVVVQVAIAMFGVSAVFCSQTERFQRWAPVLGLLGQPFWFVATYSAGQWGIFALAFLYSYAWAMGFWRYWVKDSERFGSLKCWLKTGHKWDKTGTSRMMSRSMNTCVHCGMYEAGPD